jgi:hypothetical protein
MRKVKCPACNTMNDKNEAEKIGNRYYCISCATERKEEIEKNTDGWDELFNYICELYEIEKPTGMMFGQLKRYREAPYNFTNMGMYLTLKYVYEILEREQREDAGLGIIEWEYENAKKHYIDIMNIEEYMEDFVVNEEEKTINIKPSNNVKENKQLEIPTINEEVLNVKID